MIKIPDKSFLKRLNDLNQEMKNIFVNYSLFPNGVIMAEKKDKKLYKGDIIITTSYKFLDEFRNNVIHFNSDNIFQTIKNHKKDITGIKNENGVLYFVNDDESFISLAIAVLRDPHPQLNKLMSELLSEYSWIHSLNDKIVDIPKHMSIDNDGVNCLIKNGVIPIESNGFRTRITKQLVPSIKKNDEIFYYCIPKDDDTFYVNIILMKKVLDINVLYRYTALRL